MKNIPVLLKKEMIKQGLDYAKLARRCDVSPHTIKSALETKKGKLYIYESIADALNVQLKYKLVKGLEMCKFVTTEIDFLIEEECLEEVICGFVESVKYLKAENNKYYVISIEPCEKSRDAHKAEISKNLYDDLANFYNKKEIPKSLYDELFKFEESRSKEG